MNTITIDLPEPDELAEGCPAWHVPNQSRVLLVARPDQRAPAVVVGAGECTPSEAERLGAILISAARVARSGWPEHEPEDEAELMDLAGLDPFGETQPDPKETP